MRCLLLTHWGRVTHICVSKLTIIGSDNGLSPVWRQAIIWTNDGILLIWTLVTNFSEILSEIHAFSFKKMHFKMSSAKWRPFCLGLNVLIHVFGGYWWVIAKFNFKCIWGIRVKLLYWRRLECHNSLRSNDAIQCHRPWSSLAKIMACHLYSTKPLPEPMLNHY